MRTRTTPAALTSALVFALLGACSRDVTLPPEATAPRPAPASAPGAA